MIRGKYQKSWSYMTMQNIGIVLSGLITLIAVANVLYVTNRIDWTTSSNPASNNPQYSVLLPWQQLQTGWSSDVYWLISWPFFFGILTSFLMSVGCLSSNRQVFYCLQVYTVVAIILSVGHNLWAYFKYIDRANNWYVNTYPKEFLAMTVFSTALTGLLFLVSLWNYVIRNKCEIENDTRSLYDAK